MHETTGKQESEGLLLLVKCCLLNNMIHDMPVVITHNIQESNLGLRRTSIYLRIQEEEKCDFVKFSCSVFLAKNLPYKHNIQCLPE